MNKPKYKLETDHMTGKSVYRIKILIFPIIKFFTFNHPSSKYQQVFTFLLEIILKLEEIFSAIKSVS